MGAGASFEVFAPGELEHEMKAVDATSPSTSWELFKAGYDSIVHTIIRPPRHDYSVDSALGPSEFELAGQAFRRRDFTVLNERGQALQCSIWDTEPGRSSCVLYLHGISGSRVESTSLLGSILQMGSAFAAFDFSGSGKSDGSYISMGYTEHHDDWVVLQALHKYRGGQFEAVNMYGRSMGANAALLVLQEGLVRNQTSTATVRVQDFGFSAQAICGGEETLVLTSTANNKIDFIPGDALIRVGDCDVRGKSSTFVLNLLSDCPAQESLTLSGLRRAANGTAPLFVQWLVLDSSFIDLETVLRDMVTTAQSDGWQIPSFVVSAGIALLRSTIKRTAGFDLQAVSPGVGLEKCNIPAVFVHATQDVFVPLRHRQVSLSQAYGGKKEIVTFKGTHDSLRSRDLTEAILTKAHKMHLASTKDEEAFRRELFPTGIEYPSLVWSNASKWKNSEDGNSSQSISPYSAFATGYRMVETADSRHVAYMIHVYAPPHLFMKQPSDAPNCFGEKDKESALRVEVSVDEREIKSFWKSFSTATKSSKWNWLRWGKHKQTSSWRNLATDMDTVPTHQNVVEHRESIEPTFQVERRCHDFKLLLTKLSALPSGLPNDLQVIRSKLVYSTKMGVFRLEERKELLNTALQVISSTPALWSHSIVHEFLRLEKLS
ncbi:hypothetical protein Ae201684P_017427 [Aphanomyces euteiches]|nr:hypothetical protein Ae201684P_017427 [Aphanomyces euteiches]